MNSVLKIASLARATALPHLMIKAALSRTSLHQQIRSAGHAERQNIAKTESFKVGDLAMGKRTYRNRSEVTPEVHVAFNKIFGVEENKDLLISLINAIVSTEDQVVDINLLDTCYQENSEDDIVPILAVEAVGQTGESFNVEIQITDKTPFHKVALYHMAKIYTHRAWKRSIGIYILNSIPKTDSKKYHNVFYVAEKSSDIDYSNNLKMHTIELSKFSKDSNEDIESLSKRVKSELDIWATFLTHSDLLDKEKLPEPLARETLKKALHVLETINFTEAERKSYEARLDLLRKEAGANDKAIEEGRLEGKLEVAQSMIKKGYALDDIIRLTGLSRSAVQNLLEA